MKNILQKILTRLIDFRYNDILLTFLFILLFISLGYWLTIINSIYLAVLKLTSDIFTLFILGFIFSYSLFEKNIKNKMLVTMSVSSMFVMYVLYDIFNIGTKYPVSAAGFNIATSLTLIALYFNSINHIRRK